MSAPDTATAGMRGLSATRFAATYLIETPGDVETVAAAMAGEQSTATHTRVAGETPELLRRHGAVVERIERLGTVSTPSLPSHATGAAQSFQRARVRISWPLHNIGPSLPMLMTTLMGNQTGMRDLTGLRLQSLELPEEFIRACPRPAFGITGTRRLSGVQARPLIGTIVKPNIGLAPEETAALVSEFAEAGLDFVKDDELMADPPYCPAVERAEAVLGAVRRAEDRTGHRLTYAVNITGEVDEMRRRHDAVLAAGGRCVMVNLNAVGLSGLLALRRHSQLPIHGHRAGWGAMARAPLMGADFGVYQQFWRLAGVDHLHVSGLGGKFWETAEDVTASARACLSPLLDDSDRAMPVFSGGSTVRHVAGTLRAAGSADLIMTTGGAILGHPGGPRAGVESMRAAWAAAMAGIPPDDFARDHPPLATALAHWPAHA
ncbi:RuBisCO large subunit C-terminal-like domain-containing protein [Roseomonas populi]|uniref:RuBisCO large subunit C-terminal-like domain-containing protein n=1 Tax=Roseomonas populi TaxID=3121582 RepID=A0ABT1X6W9_9PROT|nr:RuBisCO large subunit C-terminal-like domain-containing protein [Roseomonas pecuniae]MCR0983846.1 RuBisCO large subunit C-terminal-like domain-containing protein [Roseomonas pecuniae]